MKYENLEEANVCDGGESLIVEPVAGRIAFSLWFGDFCGGYTTQPIYLTVGQCRELIRDLKELIGE